MEKRKKIALLLGEPDKSDQSQFIEGFFTQIFKENIDICVFGMHKMYQSSANREIGDSKIYALLAYDAFDAIVVMADTIQTSGVIKQIEAELMEYYEGSVLFVDKESEHFPSISMDDYPMTKAVIAHLIEEHGYEDIAYLTGKSWNQHSRTRLQAYLDVMAEHNLKVRDDRIFYGDFWYVSGASMVDKLMKNTEDLPRAIACANNCMAIGVAEALQKAGKRIPEDIAVVGFDSSQEGMLSPVAITAVNIPYVEFGEHVAKAVLNMMEGKTFDNFVPHGSLFLGNSCGCSDPIDYASLVRRKQWATPDSSNGFLARYNCLSEDIMSQNKLLDMYNVIFSYTYQLEDFESFHLCLNKYWTSEKKLMDPEIDWINYTDEMVLAVKAGSLGEDTEPVSLDRLFKTQDMLPDFDEKREEPKAFFFSPIDFEEKCFGYAVISYGNHTHSVTEIYRRWIAEVMLGIEAVRRQIVANHVTDQIASNEYRDQRTGMRNYAGLKKDAENIVLGKKIVVLAIDIKGVSKINKDFGRKEGNSAIDAVAGCVTACKQAQLSGCLGNDEFLLVALDNGENIVGSMQAELLERLEETNRENSKYRIEICMGETTGMVENEDDFDRFINIAVSQKNGNKAMAKRMQEVVTFTEEDQKMADLVQDILSNNRFVYHFQPIINARTGEIYAYEALMRTDTEVRIPPLDILKYAEALLRMDEIEKYTFMNVISYVREHTELFEGRKVFINSIPGTVLSKQDETYINEQLEARDGQIVVELTEQAELDDKELNALKKKYEDLGVEIAVDDYGTGYSNVTNLLRYMPRYVKIDRMLLSEIQNSPQKQHFVSEIIEFAHNNNIIALAEGVETAEELEMVIHLGADLIQGYYVAKPSKEVLQAVPVKVKREVHQFNLQEQYNRNKKMYVSGREFRVSLAKLMSDGYECILVPNEEAAYHDLCIVGVPGSRSEIVIQIADGYHGRVELENVNLGGKRGMPCIQLGENCEVALALSGENELRTGGICVPESSRLTLEGEGGLIINCNADGYYGIGNDMEHRHGDICMEQQGLVHIHGNGTVGVGIGSGLGGNILIKDGRYDIHMVGKKGVGIGCLSGDTDVLIQNCDVVNNSAFYEGVAIGTIEGHIKLDTMHVSITCKLSGTDLVGFGSLHARSNDITLRNGNFTIALNALQVCGVGSFEGKNDIRLRYAELNLRESGTLAIAVGDSNRESSLDIHNGDVYLDCKSETENSYGIAEGKCVLETGKLHFTRNGKPVEIYE